MAGSEFLISIGGYLLKKTGDMFKNILSADITEETLNKRFNLALDKSIERIHKIYPEAMGGSLDFFFKDQHVLDELMKLLFRNSKINAEIVEEIFDIKTLPINFLSEFIMILKQELLGDQLFDLILSNNDIYFMIIGIDSNLEKISHITELSLKELEKISISVQAIIANNFSFEKFYEQYKKIAINNFSEISYIGLGLSPDIRRGPKKLNDIYVKPSFTNSNFSNLVEDTRLTELEEEIEINDLFKVSEKNIVILGDPGAGKSVLIKFIICSILEKKGIKDTKLLNQLPIRVELRKYLAHKKLNSSNITQFVSYQFEQEFSLANFSESQLIEVLKTKPTLIFFDGLDEIFNEDEKFEVKKDIENFLLTYDSVKAVVTSRFIGYEEVKLDPNLFDEFHIQEFNERRIKEYVTKWYSCEAIHKNTADKEIESFLDLKSDIDEELISNPLLLSLIVILYRNNGRLPHSKLEIYRSCTRTLVEKWDEVKKLEIDLKVKNRKESIFANLAYWQYESNSLNKDKNKQNSITYTLVKDEVSKIIQTKLKLTEDSFESSKWADEFLEYAKNRSLYFDNNFTHKTFLEYYTAFWIYQNNDLKGNFSQRDSIIKKYIGNSYWHIVIELLINLIDENQPDTEIIDALITKNLKENDDSYVFFLKILHKLKNVDESITYNIIKSSLEFCIYDLKDKFITIKLFTRIRELLQQEKYQLKVRRIFDEIALENLNNDRILFNAKLFQEEINLFARSNYKLQSPILNSVDHIRNDPFFFVINNGSIGIEMILEFIELFGLDHVNENENKFLKSKYNNLRTLGILHEFLESLVESEDSERSFSEITMLIDKGVKIDVIKKQLAVLETKMFNIDEDSFLLKVGELQAYLDGITVYK